MLVSKRSPRTGAINNMRINITEEEWNNWLTAPSRPMIQDAFPHLTPSEREFLMTGYTQEDWDAMFPPEEEDEPNENHQRCMHCGAYTDECQCDGGWPR